MVPPFNRIAMFSAKKRESDRINYKMEYVGRDAKHKKLETEYFSIRHENDIITALDMKLLDNIHDGERRAEAFLTIASSGGLVALVTIYQNEERAINSLALASAALLIVSFFIVSVLRIQNIQHSHFRYGEWRKNHFDFIHNKIGLEELAWRTHRTMRTPMHHGVLALFSLAMVVTGYIILFLSFYQRTS